MACIACKCEEAYELVGKAIHELSKQVESICSTQNKAKDNEFGDGELAPKGTDITNNEVPFINLKGLKNRTWPKNRKRLQVG